MKTNIEKYTFYIIFLLVTLAAPLTLHAQSGQGLTKTPSSPPYIWVESMVNYNTIGPGVGVKGSIDFNRHQFHLRGLMIQNQEYNQQTWETGFLYGRSMQTGNWQISGATGVAVIGGYRYSDLWGRNGAEKMDPMIGFPLEGQIYWSPVSFAGLGVYTFANVNTAQPIGGIGLSLKVGNMRDGN